MAKVSAPLFSFGASGALAKAIVYFPWKGIDAVRSYVIPANPKSGAQQSQRTKLSDMVNLWHTLGLDDDDITAWNRYALTRPSPQSGFNAFCAYGIDRMVAGVALADLAMGFDGSIVDSGVGQVDFSVKEDGSAIAVSFKWGYSPTALINIVSGGEVVNVWTALNVAAVTGSIVYMRAILSSAGPVESGSTGIFRFGPVS